MRTYLDCIPCFLRLTLEQGRLLTGDEIIHRELMNEAVQLVPGFSFGMTPPLIGRHAGVQLGSLVLKKI